MADNELENESPTWGFFLYLARKYKRTKQTKKNPLRWERVRFSEQQSLDRFGGFVLVLEDQIVVLEVNMHFPTTFR